MIFSSRYNGRAGSISLLFPVRNQRHNDLDHYIDQADPDQRHGNVKYSMCICDLSGDHFNLRSFWRNILDQCCKWLYKPDKNKEQPEILKIQCATAVLLASLLCPRLARSAVIVVPMLSPSRIGIAPARRKNTCHSVRPRLCRQNSEGLQWLHCCSVPPESSVYQRQTPKTGIS